MYVDKKMDGKVATRCKMFWNQHPATKAKVDDPAEVKGFGEIKKGFGEIKTRKRKQIKKTKINFDDPAEVKGFSSWFSFLVFYHHGGDIP